MYVLKSGTVVEQGYRVDLEIPPEAGEAEGEFRQMMSAQGDGFPVRDDEEIAEAECFETPEVEIEKILEGVEDRRREEDIGAGVDYKRLTIGVPPRMLDVVQDYTRSRTTTPSSYGLPQSVQLPSKHLSMNTAVSTNPRPKRSSKRISYDVFAAQSPTKNLKRQLSLQFTPTSPTTRRAPSPTIEDDEEFEAEKSAMERTAAEVMKRRAQRGKMERQRWSDISLDAVKVDTPVEATKQTNSLENNSIFRLARDVYPTVPYKPLLALGLVACLLSGAMTPVFSFLLSRLLFEVSIGAENVNTINLFGGIVLAAAAADGLLMGSKFFIMETSAMRWVTKLRKVSYTRVLAQDKKFFDNSENAAVRLVQIIVKDGDDARNLIAVVLGQFVVVATMLSVGLIWALVAGWQLTLAGLAIGPVFAITMSVQANFVAKCEHKNKLAREEIAKGYYEVCSCALALTLTSSDFHG